jgi:dienelactone hydrolase
MRLRLRQAFSILGCATYLGTAGVFAMSTPADAVLTVEDTRATLSPQDLNSPRTFPKFSSLAEWEARRAEIKRQILVSNGLYPMPKKTPLKAKITGRVVRDGYTIEKVSLQTYPGFYLAGNLYRPIEKHGEPDHAHPAVLVTHGHWENGRMANEERGSISARAITFARMGIVAFTYDMVGYNDTHQVPHTFAGDREHWVWGVSLMGLQTWNSIRALDFISALPDVDVRRLAITGESGGGTQTMMLGAVDDRLAAVGPCVMVSHSMQGGCLCENSPGLRVDFSNMEVAAVSAPKPQIMLAATGDWTRTMMSIEGPGVESIYKLYGKTDNLKYAIFPFEHNINRTSRNAVYQAFGKWLLNMPNADSYQEPPYQMETVEDLRVFPDKVGLPKDAISAEALTDTIKNVSIVALNAAKPGSASDLVTFKKTYLPLWLQTLKMDTATAISGITDAPHMEAGLRITRMHIGREGKGDSIPAALCVPANGKPAAVLVLASSGGIADNIDSKSGCSALVKALVAKGYGVLLFDAFLTGSRANAQLQAARSRPFRAYFDTYNLTDMQQRVQDVVTASRYVKKTLGCNVAAAGSGEAGLWAIFAAPVLDGVAADLSTLDVDADATYTADATYVPCLRRAGDIKTALTLAADRPTMISGLSTDTETGKWVSDVFTGTAGPAPFVSDALSVEDLSALLHKTAGPIRK